MRNALAKLWGSKVAGVPVGAISGLPLGSPRREKSFGCRPRGEVQGEPFTGREATTPSVIREIEKI